MLRKEDKKAVFLIDGLEEILRNVSGDLNQQKAVQTLCQDIVNIMAANRNKKIIKQCRHDIDNILAQCLNRFLLI